MRKLFMIALCACALSVAHVHPVMATGINFGDTTKANADAEAQAKASAQAHAGALALGYVKGGDQYMSSYTKLYTSYYNKLSQYQGMEYNGNVDLLIEGDVYEQRLQAPPLSVPDVSTSQVNVECPLYVQDGWSIGASVPGGAASGGATEAQKIPVCFAWLAAQNAGGKGAKLAGLTAYCLSFDEIGVENGFCKDWRSKVAGHDVSKDGEREVRIAAPDETGRPSN